MKVYKLTSSTGLTTTYTVLRKSVGVLSHTEEYTVLSLEEARTHYRQTKKLYNECIPMSQDSITKFMNNLKY